MSGNTCDRCGNRHAIHDVGVPMRDFRVCNSCLGAVVRFLEGADGTPKTIETLYCEDCGARLFSDMEHDASHTLRKITEVVSP